MVIMVPLSMDGGVSEHRLHDATEHGCDTMRQPTRLRRAQELVEGPWRHNNLDAGAAMVIPVPLPLGGVVVVGEAVTTYIDGAQPAKTVPLKSTIVRVRAGHMDLGFHRCS